MSDGTLVTIPCLYNSECFHVFNFGPLNGMNFDITDSFFRSDIFAAVSTVDPSVTSSKRYAAFFRVGNSRALVI